jgi:hypothetical protein
MPCRPGRLNSHTSPVGFGLGVLIAVLLLVVPGAIVAHTAHLSWPTSIALGPAATYGVVGVAIVPFGALGIPWNAFTALLALAVVIAAAVGLRTALARFRDPDAESRAVSRWPAITVAGGVLLGALLIWFAALRGLRHWQSIPSTWDAVWHANTIRWILETGQASPTHMGELRNVETHAALYYPSTFHALAAVLSQLTGAAPTTAYTVSSVAAAVWLFPVAAAALTWQLMRSRNSEWRTAGCAAAAAALSASFTAVPYVEFDTASMPNMAAYGIAVPAMVLIVSTPRHRDRIPLAVLALLGVFSVHITGGVVTALFVVAWWLMDALWHPVGWGHRPLAGESEATGESTWVRGRLSDLVALLLVAVPTALLLVPQFIGVLQQAEIIVGHQFVTHQGKKRALFEAIVQHTRHLNDYPIQNIVLALAAAGGLILFVKKIWWPLAVWLLLVVAIVHSSAPFGGPIGAIIGKFSDLFYSDPRRLSGVVTMLLTAWAGIGLFTLTAVVVGAVQRRMDRRGSGVVWTRSTGLATAAILLAVSIGTAWHYFPRHRYLMGEKYDSVMVDSKDLEAMAHLATLPGARDTMIGDANIDGTAWMYAVADLHPLWTHYDFPVQQGPGRNRFIIWAYADYADTDPRVAQAVQALNIRYLLTSTPVVRGFKMPDGLVSLDKSRSWEKIYDNGGARIYEWRGGTSDGHPAGMG